MLSAIKLAVFLATSAVIVRFSWRSMRSPLHHGFYRFFAWELLTALLVMNIQYAFHGPGNAYQFIAKACYLASLLLSIHGFRLLGTVGKPDHARPDPTLFWVEKTTVLVTVGAYRYVRHPLYGSLIFMTIGVYLEAPTVWAGALALPAALFLIASAKVEEYENLQFFGNSYREYMKRTKMFIPFVI
jgi:protein-S-isoprenylcysteine O-methyltransferase Ste14